MQQQLNYYYQQALNFSPQSEAEQKTNFYLRIAQTTAARALNKKGTTGRLSIANQVTKNVGLKLLQIQSAENKLLRTMEEYKQLKMEDFILQTMIDNEKQLKEQELQDKIVQGEYCTKLYLRKEIKKNKKRDRQMVEWQNAPKLKQKHIKRLKQNNYGVTAGGINDRSLNLN